MSARRSSSTAQSRALTSGVARRPVRGAKGAVPAATPRVITRFDRLELKFVVPAALRKSLLPLLLERLAPDPFGDENSAYRTATLYFDNPERDVFWEHQRGVKPRHKMRIRRYGPVVPEEAACFFEIKTRLARRVVKRRVALSVGEAMSLARGELPERPLTNLESLLVDDIRRLIELRRLEPVCLIRYRREAYSGTGEERGLRVTFDSEAAYRFASPAHFEDTSSEGVVLAPDFLILEVKVDDVVPHWLGQLLGSAGATLGSFSKYCHAVDLAEFQRAASASGNGASGHLAPELASDPVR